jgi:ABC-type transport system involved in cytochrome c biogenesis permease subunit
MSTIVQPPELAWIWFGVALYGLAATFAVLAAARSAPGAPTRHAGVGRAVPSLLAAALICIGAGIGWRWQRIGHGPFLNMFEVLASSLFSLGLIFGFAYWRVPAIRRTAAVVLPVLMVMAGWLLVSNPADTHLPPTYETPVLWFHVLLGKAFLGCALVALGIAGVILLRARPRLAARFARMPGDVALDLLAWRFMLGALTFESFMLIAGAVWAQDAWGRYWAWDPLETWAFLTWLALAAAVHVRVSWHIGPRIGALFIVGVFVLAFLTFFGVPFFASAPHKGAV